MGALKYMCNDIATWLQNRCSGATKVCSSGLWALGIQGQDTSCPQIATKCNTKDWPRNMKGSTTEVSTHRGPVRKNQVHRVSPPPTHSHWQVMGTEGMILKRHLHGSSNPNFEKWNFGLIRERYLGINMNVVQVWSGYMTEQSSTFGSHPTAHGWWLLVLFFIS